jgi:hypothetical protein
LSQFETLGFSKICSILIFLLQFFWGSSAAHERPRNCLSAYASFARVRRAALRTKTQKFLTSNLHNCSKQKDKNFLFIIKSFALVLYFTQEQRQKVTTNLIRACASANAHALTAVRYGEKAAAALC